MRKYICLALVLIAVSISLFFNYLREIKTDIRAAKSMTVTYLGQTQTINSGLNNLAGEEGSIQWSTSEISNSDEEHLSEVEAIVSAKDKYGQIHTAQYNFYINHNTGRKTLDYCNIDGKLITLQESLRQIVSGSFS